MSNKVTKSPQPTNIHLCVCYWEEEGEGGHRSSEIMTDHKNDFAEIMGLFQLFRTTYLKKVHMQKIGSLVH